MANTVSRSLHDVGLSAWFGGTLANAVGLNKAAAEAHGNGGSGAVAHEGWDRWTPVNAAAIGLHLAGSVGQLAGNTERLKAQKGVGTMALVKTGLTAAALGATDVPRARGRHAGRPAEPLHAAVGRAGHHRCARRDQLVRR